MERDWWVSLGVFDDLELWMGLGDRGVVMLGIVVL